MIWFEKTIEVRYADTDQMGVIHHGVHPLYCELSRLHICQELGLPYHKMEDAGFYLMVATMQFRFLAPARFGEEIYVRGAISRLNKRLIDFTYEVKRRPCETLLCSGSTSHVVTRRTDGPGSLPPEFVEILSKGVASS